MFKISAHPHDRVQERSNLSPEVVDRAQSLLAKLPDDGQERYHWTLKQDGALKGYLLVKRVGSDNRPVVSTFIGPEMKTHNKGPDLYHRLGDPLVKAAELRTTLLPHQQRVVDRIQKEDQPGLLVVHGLGSGKTLTSIAAQDALKMPATVVVPAALQENYRKEQQKHLKGKPQHTDIETLQRVARRGSPTPNDMLIVDEAHRVRDPSSASHKALGSNEADKRILLTGSPFYNHPSDIAPLINLAAGKEVLPPGKDAFSDRYISIKKESPGLWNKYVRGAQDSETPVLNQSRAKELSATFQKWVDHHPGSKDNFPDVRREDVIVPMGDQQKKVYDTLMGQAPAWVAAKVRQGLPPSKQEAASLTAFLTGPRQVANSSVGFHEKGDPQSPKIQKAFENLQGMLKDNPEGRAVVYSNYLEAGINPYRKLLQGAGVPHGEFTGSQTAKDRDQMVRDYNEGKLRALLLSSAGGEGLDLKGTRMVQILEPHWNEEKLKQVEGRAARFKSHEALPEDQRNVIIQRYLAGTPVTTGVKIKQKLLGIQPDQTVDQYLTMMSKNKEDLNQQFRGLLPTHKTASDLLKEGAPQALSGNAIYMLGRHFRKHKEEKEEKTAAKLTHFAGLRVRIDRPKGFVQKGKDKEGKPWERVYKVDYGFLPGTQGGDGDGLDVFLGPDEKADPAYLVYQKKDDGSFDEFKLMLGFEDGASARACYVDHIPSKFLGKMEALSLNVVRALTGQPLDEEAIVKKAFLEELSRLGEDKVASTRYEREIAANNILRSDVMPVEGADLKTTRDYLSRVSDLPKDEVDLRRKVNEKRSASLRKNPPVPVLMHDNVNPSTGAAGTTMDKVPSVFVPTSGMSSRHDMAAAPPDQQYRDMQAIVGARGRRQDMGLPSSREDAVGDVLNRYYPPAASDATQTYATLRHELGEAEELYRPGSSDISPSTRGEARALTEKTNRPFSSHLGSTPILREQEAVLGDPEAQKALAHMRQLGSEDAHVQKLIKQVGGTPDVPLPIGGRQHRSLDRLIDANTKPLGERARGVASVLGHSKVPYLPKNLPSWGDLAGVPGDAPVAQRMLSFLKKGI